MDIEDLLICDPRSEGSVEGFVHGDVSLNFSRGQGQFVCCYQGCFSVWDFDREKCVL